MNVEFYLFDVDHGQCAALKLPNGRWCLFDAGCTSSFSPIRWIVSQGSFYGKSFLNGFLNEVSFKFYMATISHFHGDHLADWQNLFKYGPEFIRTVQPDKGYVDDCKSTSTEESWPVVSQFIESVRANYSGSAMPDYGGVRISEMSLPVAIARQIGGDANARVNNASIVTRIDVFGNSILLCGDVMKDAWAEITKIPSWQRLVSNIDVLVAPHHGHSSGYSNGLLKIAKPAVVLVSAVSRDPNVDGRYSLDPVRGITIGGTPYGYISTRQKGHIKITINPPQAGFSKGKRNWSFGDDVTR